MTFPVELQQVSPHVRDRWPKIVEEAKGLIDGDRMKAYGPPERNLARIAARWTKRMGHKFTASDVARMMQDVKLSRLEESPHHHDSIVDYAAYGEIATRVHNAEINSSSRVG